MHRRHGSLAERALRQQGTPWIGTRAADHSPLITGLSNGKLRREQKAMRGRRSGVGTAELDDLALLRHSFAVVIRKRDNVISPRIARMCADPK